MKKLIIMAGLLLVMAHAAFAEQWGVFMKIHHYCPVKILDLEINRVDHHPLGR